MPPPCLILAPRSYLSSTGGNKLLKIPARFCVIVNNKHVNKKNVYVIKTNISFDENIVT